MAWKSKQKTDSQVLRQFRVKLAFKFEFVGFRTRIRFKVRFITATTALFSSQRTWVSCGIVFLKGGRFQLETQPSK